MVGYYRGSESEVRARRDDFIHAIEEDVRYEFLAQPVRFIGDEQGHVRQIEMQRMRSKSRLQPEQSMPSRMRIPIPGSNYIVPADVVVLAIGYGGDDFIPSRTPALTSSANALRFV